MRFPQFTKAEREQTGSETAGNSNSGEETEKKLRLLGALK